jgi:hypothetical protein
MDHISNLSMRELLTELKEGKVTPSTVLKIYQLKVIHWHVDVVFIESLCTVLTVL